MLRVAFGLVLASALAAAQQISFDVASIKVRTVGISSTAAIASPDRFNRFNTLLRDLVRDAYNLQPFQVVNGPEWMATTRFDVQAKAPFVPSPEQMRAMVRQLLADRFALKAHMETREMPAYALVLARSDGRLGPQISRTAIDCAALDVERARKGEARPVAPAQRGDAPVCATFTSTQSRASAAGVSITMRRTSSGTPLRDLAAFLAMVVKQPVLDRTGLEGDFDITLEFAPARGPSVAAGPAGDSASVFTALQEQLGLKLETVRGPVDVLVIDSVSELVPD